MATVMPRVSGILNNCALHCGIPFIKTKIAEFAHQEPFAGRLGEGMSPATYLHYHQLKNCFAEYYQLNGEQFTWQHFHNLLASFQGNFYKEQLTLGPVFRLYMQKQLTSALEQMQGQSHLHQRIFVIQSKLANLTTIQAAGEDRSRYGKLSSQEASEFFYQSLGIALKEYVHYSAEECEILGIRVDADGYSQDPYVYPVSEPIASLSIYYKNDHFELLPESRRAEANAQSVRELQALNREQDTGNTPFLEFITACGNGEPQHTKNALARLKAHIKACVLKLLKLSEPEHTISATSHPSAPFASTIENMVYQKTIAGAMMDMTPAKHAAHERFKATAKELIANRHTLFGRVTKEHQLGLTRLDKAHGVKAEQYERMLSEMNKGQLPQPQGLLSDPIESDDETLAEQLQLAECQRESLLLNMEVDDKAFAEQLQEAELRRVGLKS